MRTTQNTIARLESGMTIFSGGTLQKFAKETGIRLKTVFEGKVKSSKGGAA
jgi:transcriptional regulator with XRE-family HTH domain